MDHRDDWTRDARNMDAVLSAMAEQLSESLPAGEFGQAVPPRRRTAWRGWTLAPLAAAAAVAALILVRGKGIEQTGAPDPSAGAPRTPSMMAEMDVEADRPFVVFPTSDPGIAVVWMLNPKESD